MPDYTPEDWDTGDTFTADDATAMSQEIDESETELATKVSVVVYSGSLGAARPTADAVYWVDFPSTPTNAEAQDIIAGSPSNVDVADFAASAIVTAAEGLASSDNDTSIPTTAAVIDGIAAGGGGGGTNPYHVEIPSTILPSAASGATTFAYQASSIYNATIHAGTAINNYMEWDFVCGAGTYTLRTIYGKATNEGIATISIDGGDLGTTIDMYGTFAVNTVTDITGIALTSGRHQIRFRAASKNASSTFYVLLIQGFTLTRTGA